MWVRSIKLKTSQVAGFINAYNIRHDDKVVDEMK